MDSSSLLPQPQWRYILKQMEVGNTWLHSENQNFTVLNYFIQEISKNFLGFRSPCFASIACVLGYLTKQAFQVVALECARS